MHFPPRIVASCYIIITSGFEMLSSRPSLLQRVYLITSLFKTNEKCSLDALRHPVYISYSRNALLPLSLHCPLLPPSVHCCLLPFCKKKKMRNALWAPFPLQYAFLIIFLNKIMKKALLALGALPPPVLISYCSFVVKEWEMLF